MQSGNAPNLANLNLIFQQHDSDHDGQVIDQELEQILKQVGYTDIYMGTIRKVIRLLNLQDPLKKTLSFPQVQEFASAMVTQGQFKIWKAKYRLMENIKQFQAEIYAKQENKGNPTASGAGPGSAPSPTPKPKCTGNQQASISLKVGNSQTYNQRVSLKIQKKKGPQMKTFMKISIERKTNEQAKRIQTLFKQIYDTLIELIKAEDQWFIPDIMSVSFITNVQGNVFNLFVTTNNQGLNEIVQLVADYFDLTLKQPVGGKIQGSFQFNFDFEKFLTQKSYNIHDIVVKDSKFEIQWTLWEIFSNFREIALKRDLLKQLIWNPTEQFSLFMIGLLHTEKFTGKVEFQNTSTENQQTKSKQILANLLAGYRKILQNLQNESQMKVVDLVQEIDGKIKIQAGVRDCKLDFEADLTNFSKLFTKTVEGYN